jgi:predicted amidophosphoribosyltransferase
VRSNSTGYLSREERFANITENLELSEGVCIAAGDKVIVVDDVVTTGSSLIGAEKLLRQNGVGFIKLVAMAKNVTQIMPEKWRSDQVYPIENS